MSTPVDAERAWADLQRIRIPQERVYDEVERHRGGWSPKSYLTTAAVMWVFLAVSGLDGLPQWVHWLLLAGYVALLAVLAVRASRRTRVRLHHSRYTWRSYATLFGAAGVTGATILLSDRLARWADLPCPSLFSATVTVGVFLLFGPAANRWCVSALRDAGAGR
ncbi:hypothetical protein KGS77_01285 [Streptomyces sp. MST-110588]|nr:hypothetical protein KGS77_01285 [Streptomyces sp. MST-110588]